MGLFERPNQLGVLKAMRISWLASMVTSYLWLS